MVHSEDHGDAHWNQTEMGAGMRVVFVPLDAYVVDGEGIDVGDRWIEDEVREGERGSSQLLPA